MGQKTAATSARVDRKLSRELGRTRGSARTAARRRAAHAAKSLGDQSLDRGRSARPAGPQATSITGPEVTDDFPEFAAVLDRELDAIEAYLGACLDEVLGGMD